MIIKDLIKKILFGHKASSKSLCKFLRKKGVNVGNGVFFFNPRQTHIDLTRPYLVSIGNNVKISTGFVLLTHDFGWSVIKGINGSIVGNAKPVSIGSNVFFGFNVLVLGGVMVGDNVIIGAGSVVTKSIPSNEVWAGNPAHFICTIEQYILKRESLLLHDAEVQFIYYYQRFNCIPKEEEFHEFFTLWHNPNEQNLNKAFSKKLYINGYNSALTDCYYNNHSTKIFSSYQEFIDHCFKIISQKQK